ncbi:queuosine precursor transporter [Aurantimonas aggregata]|uniref:Probable queuosine precursor transporter n=1 Tax=Aurantimonas aggregata TaxID=2047720 RepID=A0A6L9MLZ0_9HYPH|nr:queuosine precursor transporter [Aurantimonas aggregata]NDV88712.1 queuosine precursor transporter [Aurantimonas aggregata]
MTSLRTYLLPVAAMTAIVLASNVAVQFPVFAQIGSLQLADVLTWGAFTYGFAFLVTDLTNRRYGAAVARRVVMAGFATAILCSVVVPPILYDLGWLEYATTGDRLLRIALASGGAFLVAQLLDIAVFNRLRQAGWWRAPAASSVSGSVVDTFLFFTIAFAPVFAFVGPNDGFALEAAPLFGVFATEAPRWVSWALGDLTVKLAIAVLALVPYRLIMQQFAPYRSVDAGASV